MSDLKFSCPSCGQHIRCDAAHAGENIPCPGCALLIRVPETGAIVAEVKSAEENPFATDASKVSYTEPAKENHPEISASTPKPVFTNSDNETDPTPVPVTERERQIAAARESHPVSVNPIMKPRLAYVLNGEQPPPTEKVDDKSPPEIRTVHE